MATDMLKLHLLKNNHLRKSRKRVGRGVGGNWGRTCGRGEKGQLSRSGSKRRPHFEGGQIPLFRRLPKKGFKNPNHKEFAIVNLSDLEKYFDDGETVDVEGLRKIGMIGKLKSGLKILANGEISKSFKIKATHFSISARKKIERVGGTCEIE